MLLRDAETKQRDTTGFERVVLGDRMPNKFIK